MRNGRLRVGDHVILKHLRWEDATGQPFTSVGPYVVRSIYQKDGYRTDWLTLAKPGMGDVVGTFSAQDVRQ